ncbi:MAG: hypothetical protein WDO71_09270 [Bacteroidota bacterium]
MRKFYITLLPVLLVYCTSFGQAQVSSPVYKIARDYFRSDPFQEEFSSFLIHLLNDPGISGKLIEKRTDTSLFSSREYLKTITLFSLNPKEQKYS